MSWIDKFSVDSMEAPDSRYVKLTGETDVELDLTVEPVGRNVKGTDGKDRLYWDVHTTDNKILSCTNYLFVSIRRELEKLRGKEVTRASIRIRKVVGEKVSWVVVLVAYS